MKKAFPDCSTSMEGLDTVQIAHEPLALPIHGAFLLFIYRARDRLLIPTLQTIRTPTTGCEIEPVVIVPPLPCDSILGVASRNFWRRVPRTDRSAPPYRVFPMFKFAISSPVIS
jgi:hypothetical protein